MQHTSSALLFLTASLAACGACSDEPPGDGKTFVLVHGAFMGAAGWDAVAKELRDDGATVHVVELPAHGKDTTPPAAATLDGYVARVGEALDAADRPAILVGHSMGGIVISQLAERRPADVARLVYVAAYVPASGQSLLELAYLDAASQLGKHLHPRDDGTIDVDADAFPDVFCADCDASARAALIAGYRAEPTAPLGEKVTLGAAFANVPKLYVRTTEDRVVSPALQDQMIAATPMQKTIDLPTSHVPLLAQPARLADALLD